MFSLYSASTSMNCFTSSTVKKCRATSSIAPRHAKRGRSVIVPGGTSTRRRAPSVRQLHLDRRGEQLSQRLHAAEHAGRRRAGDAHRVRADRELIAFVAERRLAAEPEHDRAARRRGVARRDGDRARRRDAQQRGEHLSGARQLGVPRRNDDARRRRDRERRAAARRDREGSGTSRCALNDAGISEGGVSQRGRGGRWCRRRGGRGRGGDGSGSAGGQRAGERDATADEGSAWANHHRNAARRRPCLGAM